ncbi:MAG: hypothetical protein ACW99G_21880 [Candidatus Thorarchaeota archaeon]|jgi:hypothetical protein
MEYHLRFSIDYDDIHWKQDTFQEDKHKVHKKILQIFNAEDSTIEDWYIEFKNGSPELATNLKKWCKVSDYKCTLWVFPSYTKEEIKTARYVPLGTRYDLVDRDDDNIPYNVYTKTLCNACRCYDMDFIPSPYRVDQSISKPKRDISYESNGVVILSETAFNLLRNEIEQWVIWGDVEVVGDDSTNSNKEKYVWIRPTSTVGSFVDSRILQKCIRCNRSTEIRRKRSEDIFEFNKWTVDSFKNSEAPIVMAGNWYGDMNSGGASMVNRYVFISGELHEKIRKLKLKGFVKADAVIHAADEPYDWDPLKYRSPTDTITGHS